MIKEPRCAIRSCKHLLGVKQDHEDEFSERVVCAAFPDGIPSEIAYGKNPHDRPLPDQENDIIYEYAP